MGRGKGVGQIKSGNAFGGLRVCGLRGAFLKASGDVLPRGEGLRGLYSIFANRV